MLERELYWLALFIFSGALHVEAMKTFLAVSANGQVHELECMKRHC